MDSAISQSTRGEVKGGGNFSRPLLVKRCCETYVLGCPLAGKGSSILEMQM